MKAQDIVDRLSGSIPLYTDGFSESVAIASIVPVGTTATVTTTVPHNIVENQTVAIIGADAPVQIDIGTFLRTGEFAEFETLQDHDLTLSDRDKAAGGKTITISGATEAEFNGTFNLVRAVNRRKLIISVIDAGPTTISGSPIVENANGQIFNGFTTAVNVTTDAFEYTLPKAYTVNAVTTGATVQNSIRIISVLDIEQFVRDVYTKQNIDDDLLVVQLGDVVLSKKRNEESDASSSTAGEDSYTPLMIQSFAIYIVINSTQDLTGAQLRDKVETEYVPAIYQSVARAKFDTGFTYSQYRATPVSHGVFAFADANGKNKAIYVHEVTFEQLVMLTKVDMVGPDTDVAMRDIEYTLTTNLGTGELTATIDLDEEPI